MEDQERFLQLVRKMDPRNRFLRAWPLEGGVSAQITAVEIELPSGRAKKLVVRRHGAADLMRNPNIAADEFALLEVLQTTGVPAPKPCFFDASGEFFATPCLVVEYIEGKTEFEPADPEGFVFQLATLLAHIHGIAPCKRLAFLPRAADRVDRLLQARPAVSYPGFDAERVRETLESARPLAGPNPPVLLHGDFWPGNVLWNEGRLVGVIDWEDAELGDPLADLSNARLEILLALGAEAMEQFTLQYRSIAEADFASLPHWDLLAALQSAPKVPQWGLGGDAERKAWEQLGWFAARALGRISVP